MARNLNPAEVGPRTLAVHGGERPDPATGASAPNIVMSSTFVTDSPEGFSAHDMTADSPMVYSRWANPTVRQLEQKLALMEGAEACACFGSGMAAAAAILFAELSAGDHLILSDICYAGIAELARDTLPRMGVAVSRVDTSDPAMVRGAMREQTRLVFIDTPTNPLTRLTDIRAVAEIAHGAGARVAVDSTFASPLGSRPLALGADYVMHSLTKYVGGHGDALGGAVLGAEALIRPLVAEAVVHYGGVLSPFNAWLIGRGAATLPLRLAAHQAGALAVAEWLEGREAVDRVYYPGLDSHPQRELAERQMQNCSGMLSFRVKGDEAAGQALAERLAKELSIIHYAVSLGHHRTLICWMPTEGLLESSFAVEGESLKRFRDWAGPGLFRLSVGLEEPEDLIRDLSRVL